MQSIYPTFVMSAQLINIMKLFVCCSLPLAVQSIKLTGSLSVPMKGSELPDTIEGLNLAQGSAILFHKIYLDGESCELVNQRVSSADEKHSHFVVGQSCWQIIYLLLNIHK